MNPTPLNFWAFIAERQKIWHLRDIGQPGPWTQDKVLSERRFTNMYRCLDRGTRFCVMVQESASFHNEALFNSLVYRYFNKEETWNAIAPALRAGFWDLTISEIDKLEKPFGNAYIASGQGGKVNGSLGRKVMENFIYPLYKDMNQIAHLFSTETDTRRLMKALQKYNGVGPFLAYQMVADTSYPLLSRGGLPLSVVQLEQNVHLGPGALKGLEMLGLKGAPRPLEQLFSMQFEELPKYGMPWLDPIRGTGQQVPLWLSDLEHALCEYQKYLRVSSGRAGMRHFETRAHTCTNLPRISPWYDSREKMG